MTASQVEHAVLILLLIPSADYVVIGPRFSNLVLQTLLVLVNKNPPPVRHKASAIGGTETDVHFIGVQGHRLLILGTTSLPEMVLLEMELSHVFQFSVTVPYLTQGEQVVKVLKVRSEMGVAKPTF